MALQRHTPLRRNKPLRSGGSLKRTPLAKKGKSDTAKIKDDIQALLRSIVILRDRGCVVGSIRDCGNQQYNPEAVYQAEHLIERSDSATYADPRLVVCVCKSCHYWKHIKKSNHDAYDAMIKQLIEPERVALWEACAKELQQKRGHRMTLHDWQKEAAFLKTKLRALDPSHPLAA